MTGSPVIPVRQVVPTPRMAQLVDWYVTIVTSPPPFRKFGTKKVRGAEMNGAKRKTPTKTNPKTIVSTRNLCLMGLVREARIIYGLTRIFILKGIRRK